MPGKQASGGSVLPPSVLTFSVDGTDPTVFQFKGNLHADDIGPVREWTLGWRTPSRSGPVAKTVSYGVPAADPARLETDLRGGEMYAQVAFSAASDQGFEAGARVLKAGSAWMPDNEINGVDFVLPFRLSRYRSLGTRGPVTLRIDEVKPGHSPKYHRGSPWRLSPTEANPLLLTNVKVEALGGKITMQQLRMPQHDPALLRVDNISSSELISAVNPKQFAMSGPVSARCRSGWTMKMDH